MKRYSSIVDNLLFMNNYFFADYIIAVIA